MKSNFCAQVTTGVEERTPQKDMTFRGVYSDCAGEVALAYVFFNSFNISRAAFAPEPPVSPAPGCVPLPHKYKF